MSPLRPWVGLTTLRHCHVDKIHTCLILEIKNAIWEIKRDKFWKSKVSFEKWNVTNFGNQKCMSFEKSNATNFVNQKCHLGNQTRQILSYFGNQKHYLRNQMTSFWKLNIYWKNQTGKFWKSKMHLRKQTRQVLNIKH